MSELIPFFDELLPTSGILPRIREELETVLARQKFFRIPQDSPEYEKLQKLLTYLEQN